MPRLTTTQQGLGWTHQKERKRQLQELARHPGTPCHRCGRPMYVWQKLDLDHLVARALGGQGPRRLAHARCNRQAGQHLGHQLRRRTTTPRRATTRTNSRSW
jgi:hypothetical protein